MLAATHKTFPFFSLLASAKLTVEAGVGELKPPPIIIIIIYCIDSKSRRAKLITIYDFSSDSPK